MKRLSLIALLLPFALLVPVGNAPAKVAPKVSFVYHWPVKPFDRQHPVRGVFGDPRTLVKDQPFGVTRPNNGGSYSFHSGIDIVAPNGTPVYPVVSGRVVFVDRHEISVSSSHGRRFDYWHLRGNVSVGQEVVAERTVLGWMQKPFHHVHLGEVDGGRDVNPLARGHLEPYADHTTPHALGLRVRAHAVAFSAVDAPAMRLVPPFAGLPQVPALVEWRLRMRGPWSAWHVAADFRQTIPTSAYFWTVYGDGTFQNCPVFGAHFYRGVAGRYLFRTGLDPSRLAPGEYLLEARVADIRGNASTTTWPLWVG